MAEYTAIWPIEDNTATTAEMVEVALADLNEMLEMAGLCIDGPIRWRRASKDLVAAVPVVPEYPAIEGDMRPWMSRSAAAAEWFDRVAA